MSSAVSRTVDSLMWLFGGGVGFGAAGLLTQSQVLSWVGIVSTVAGAVGTGALVFYRRVAQAQLDVWRDWDRAKSESFGGRLEAAEAKLRQAEATARTNEQRYIRAEERNDVLMTRITELLDLTRETLHQARNTRQEVRTAIESVQLAPASSDAIPVNKPEPPRP